MISLNLEQPGAREVTLAQIEAGCGLYETECAKLETLISDLETDLEAVKQKHLRGLKRQANIVANCQAGLQSLIETAPGLFVKPRTLTIHGVKVGFTVSEGKLEFDDEETVISLIEKEYGRSAGTYIRTEKSVNKDALKTLEPAELKKVGCKINGAGDVVVLKRVSGEIEKLINKLIAKLVEAMGGKGLSHEH